jgi:hypothetical protein
MVGINTSISRRAADGLAITSINFSLKSSVPVKWMQKKDLVAVAYAKPGAGLPAGAVAVAEKQPAEAGQDDQNKSYTVKSDDGSAVVVVEPDKGEEVADVSWKEASSSSNVSGTIKLTKGKEPAAQAKPEPKILTPRRPYKLDPFVQARIREIKALEKDMDMARDRIDEVRGKKGKRPSGAKDGNGLW